MRKLRKSVPLLSWMATTKLALYYRPECTRITASIAVAISIDIPKSSYAFPIDPHLTLPHASHVQSQGLVSFWCIKTGLQVQSDMLIYTYRFWIYFESTLNPIKQCKEENKTIVSKSSFMFPTLYHVSGCCLCAIKDPCIQPTDEKEFGEPNFMDSPRSPTCIKGKLLDSPIRQKLMK